jgi:DNA-binding response OmpR family regulator
MQAGSKAVLIVDDEQDIVCPIAFRLEVEGFRVIIEPDGQLGYDRAVLERPDLILLDVMMPGIDGVTVCRMLKQRAETAGIPIVMVTAKTTMGDVEHAFGAGADDYISKPFEWPELLAKVQRLID